MTFVRNKNYQLAHNKFKQIKELIGLDETLFQAMLELESIGIVSEAILYEKWCLLQIVKILMDKFRLFPEENWKYKLIQIGVDQRKAVSIKFHNQNTCRIATLHYQKDIPHKEDPGRVRTPDFMLDVRSTLYPNQKAYRLVMDAKTHERQLLKPHNAGISEVIRELYINSDYALRHLGEHHSVFILHPYKNAVTKRFSPLDWGKDSYYGEVPLSEFAGYKDMQEFRNADHKYGAICVSPFTNEARYLDDLQRLIGMFFQYGMRDRKTAKTPDLFIFKPALSEKIFCTVCGSHQHDIEIRKTTRGEKYWTVCKDCKHFTVYSYCFACKNKIFKHGSYWTYHSSQPLTPTNVVCPDCNDLL